MFLDFIELRVPSGQVSCPSSLLVARCLQSWFRELLRFVEVFWFQCWVFDADQDENLEGFSNVVWVSWRKRLYYGFRCSRALPVNRLSVAGRSGCTLR